ncbi:hypothetical protein E2C01_074243 [Portunus trituberculatus]|uniref:Uncharacterized protein n=1 Tax=Portunus trituberculatus TaxID=210409 RepID=A0A5B7I7J2_PORTR|nr:hypothetical protein [Portunus trituberculatus]
MLYPCIVYRTSYVRSVVKVVLVKKDKTGLVSFHLAAIRGALPGGLTGIKKGVAGGLKECGGD